MSRDLGPGLLSGSKDELANCDEAPEEESEEEEIVRYYIILHDVSSGELGDTFLFKKKRFFFLDSPSQLFSDHTFDMPRGLLMDDTVRRAPTKPRTCAEKEIPREVIAHILSFALYGSPHRVKGFVTPSARALKTGLYLVPDEWMRVNYTVHRVKFACAFRNGGLVAPYALIRDMVADRTLQYTGPNGKVFTYESFMDIVTGRHMDWMLDELLGLDDF